MTQLLPLEVGWNTEAKRKADCSQFLPISSNNHKIDFLIMYHREKNMYIFSKLNTKKSYGDTPEARLVWKKMEALK